MKKLKLKLDPAEAKKAARRQRRYDAAEHEQALREALEQLKQLQKEAMTYPWR